MKLVTLTALALIPLLAGCETKHHARVDDGAGLDEGDPVMVSGVRVGEVREIVVVEGQVDVVFVIDDEHDVTLREDSCALALRGEGGPTLVLAPGQGPPLTEERPIPQCAPASPELREMMGQLGDAVGGMLRDLLGGGGASGGGRPGVPNIPGLPFPGAPSDPPSSDRDPEPGPAPTDVPPPPSFDGTCGGLSVEVGGVEAADPVPLVMPQGGHRVWLVFSNASDRPMRIGSISQATFTDSGRRTSTPARAPNETCAWFMPFDVPAHGTARKCVLFEGSDRPRIDEIEARRSGPASDPLDWCTLRATGLAR